MNRQILNFSFLFAFVILLQSVVLNNIHVFGIACSYFYIIFLILLPVELNRNLALLLAFLLGLSIDLFSSTWGLHTTACLITAYFRPLLLRLLAPRDGYLFGVVPNLSSMGFIWFITYAGIMVAFHHTILLLIESFRISELGYILLKSTASTLLTLVLIFIAQMLTYKPSRNL